MARYLGLGCDEPTEDSERVVAQALRGLSDEWTVLHHVAWQAYRAGREGDGEADFVLIHPRDGAIVVEVKGGDVSIENGRWRSVGRLGRTYDIRNPFEQAVESKHALVRWLQALGYGAFVRVGHAVVFPHMERLPPLGPLATKEITWNSRDLLSIAETVERTRSHWNLNASLGTADLKKIVGSLAPTVEIRRSIIAQAQRAEQEIIRLTAEQIEVFSGLRSARGGLVIGGAGTGKTVLAVARAMQLVNDGFRTLLVCYNELLGDDLCSRVRGVNDLYAWSYHALCFKEANRAKLSIPRTPNSNWWEMEAPEMLVSACAHNGTVFDAIVVDEFQDFSPEWHASLKCLLAAPDDAPLFMFADSHQEIWNRNWESIPTADVIFELRQNMRNTRPIAAKVCKAVARPPPQRGIDGPEPQWRYVEDPANSEADTITAVEQALSQGFAAHDIVVVCESATLAAKLRERTIGPYSFGQWQGNGIAVETISRFKGLEAAVVILSLDGSTVDQSKVLAYIGMSRARSWLMVVGTQATKDAVSW